MASNTNNTFHESLDSVKNMKLYMNKRRDCGLEYVSGSGKLIPAKSQPSVYCHCPQRCQKKMPREKWRRLFEEFYGLADQAKQNQFLKSHILIKRIVIVDHDNKQSRPLHKRRVTCKYYIPALQEDESLDMFLHKMSEESLEVCQKAFMNVLGVTEKRVRMQREQSISNLSSLPDLHPIPHKFSQTLPTQHTPSINNPKMPHKEKTDEVETPLDLSNHSERTGSPIPIEIDKDKLYALAEMLGIPKSTVDREMVEKYEQMVRKNLEKQQRIIHGVKKEFKAVEAPAQKHIEVLKMPKIELSFQRPLEDALKKNEHITVRNKTKEVKSHVIEVSPRTMSMDSKLRGISEQVVGLQDNLAILPIQTLNNGDLTITPILTSTRPVENHDIMQVNNFFHNQLWRPEYIGLPPNTDVK